MKKEKKLKLPAKAALWYIASSAVSRGVTLLFTPIFTRVLTAAEYGLYTLFSSWLTILTIPATFEIASSVFMRASQRHREDRATLRSSALITILGLNALFCALYFLFLHLFPHFSAPRGKLAVFIFLQIALNSVLNVYLSDAKFSYRSRCVFLINAVLGIFTATLSLILIEKTAAPEWARIISQITVSLGVCIPLLFIIFKDGFKISFPYVKELLTSSVTLLPHYLALAVISKADKLVLGAAFGADALARYSVADTLGSLIGIAIGALFSALVPWIMRKISAGEEYLVASVSRHSVVLIAAFSVILSALTPELMQILAPEEYGEAIFAFYPIALSTIPYFLFTVYSVAFAHGSEGLWSSLSSALGAAVALFISFISSRILPYPFISFSVPLAYFAACLTASCIYDGRHENSVVKIRHGIIVFGATLSALLLSYIMREIIVGRMVLAVASLIPITISAKGLISSVFENARRNTE